MKIIAPPGSKGDFSGWLQDPIVEEITELLAQVRSGEPEHLKTVFSALYPRLRQLAAARLEREGSTFTPTVLVHELYLRFSSGAVPSISDRKHFYATAARAMRWILVDHARRHGAEKRGGGQRAEAVDPELLGNCQSAQIIALHNGLEDLDKLSPQRRQVVELRYFAGLQFSEIAELLECSTRTVHREWDRAKAFLHTQIREA